MTVSKRIKMIQVAEKIEKNLAYSGKLGVNNVSSWKGEKDELYSNRSGDESNRKRVQRSLEDLQERDNRNRSCGFEWNI